MKLPSGTWLSRREFLKSFTAACAFTGPAAALAADDALSSIAKAGTTLPQRLLGKTGLQVSALALGGVIGMQLPPSADHDPMSIAETALDLGVTYFDTAPSYNNGQSETNYGRVQARRRKEVFLATKSGDRTHDGTLRSIEASLKRLQTDRVDLNQVHGISPNEDLDAWDKPVGVLTALRKLRDQKVTGFIGLTGHDSASRLREAIERCEFDTLLTTLNPVLRRLPFRDELLPAANRKQMGVVAMKGMGGGDGCRVAGNPLRKVLRPYPHSYMTNKQPKPVESATGRLLDDIEILATPGHTLSHHSLRFDCEGMSVVLAGDWVPTRDFWRERRGDYNCVDFELSAKTMDRIASLADVVVPGHDNYFLNANP